MEELLEDFHLLVKRFVFTPGTETFANCQALIPSSAYEETTQQEEIMLYLSGGHQEEIG